MNGPAHMIFSASMYIATAGLVHDHLVHEPLTAGTLVAGGVVAAGAGLIADLDTPMSRASRALGPITGLISRIITPLSGGHRYGTHSVFAVLGVWWGTAAFLGAWGDSLWAMLALTTFLISFAVRELVGERIPSLFVLFVSLAGGLGCIAVSASYQWLLWSIVVGYALHIVADSLTTEGARIFWPATSKSFGPRMFDGDSKPATLVTMGVGTLLIFLLVAQLVMPALAANHPDLLRQSPALQRMVDKPVGQP